MAAPLSTIVHEPEAVKPVRRHISETRELTAPPMRNGFDGGVDPSVDLAMPSHPPDTWQDRLWLSMTDDGLAQVRWPGDMTLSHLRQILAVPRSWRQTVEQLMWRGIVPGELIPAVAAAEAKGWITLVQPSPDEPLNLAAFLTDVGLLDAAQVAALFRESAAFRDGRFDAFCKELIQRKMLGLAKAGFVNRLGRHLAWQVVPPPMTVGAGSSGWVQQA